MDILDAYGTEISKFEPLSKSDELKLVRKWHRSRNRNIAYRDEVIKANLRFVLKTAHKYKGYGLPLSDIVQEGNVGLIKAFNKFNPSRGYRFITYAVWWIEAQISKFVINNHTMVKFGTTQFQRKMFFKVRNILSELYRNNVSEEEAIDIISEDYEVDAGYVRDVISRITNKDSSLNQTINESDTTFQDMIEDNTSDIEEESINLQLKELLYNIAYDTVKDYRERFILENRILSDDPIKLHEIGEYFNISRERARQIENEIISRIRKNFQIFSK